MSLLQRTKSPTKASAGRQQDFGGCCGNQGRPHSYCLVLPFFSAGTGRTCGLGIERGRHVQRTSLGPWRKTLRSISSSGAGCYG